MRVKSIQNLYLLILIFLFFLVIFTPQLVYGGFSLLEEETVETIMLALLTILSLIIYSLYRREIAKNQDRFNSAVKHLGLINVQVENLKTIFKSINKYPQNKSDWKYVLKSFGEKALGVVNCDWVIFRIIESNSGRSLAEHCQSRGDCQIPNNQISNKALLADKPLHNMTIVAASQKNFNLRAFCVIPMESISEHQRVLIDSIVNSLEMLYIIFSSRYYKA